MIRNIIKKLTHPFLKKGLQWYYHKPRKYSYEAIEVLVHPDVFPPHLTISTKILLDFMKPMDLSQKQFLELGCGSGIISLYAAKKGAKVTATDINTTALTYLKKAAENNQLKIDVLHSDLLFSQLPAHIANECEALMILSEDCAIDIIKQLAHTNGLEMQEIFTKKVNAEINYIFKIV